MAAAAALEQGPIDLPGPTGESNRLSLAPKGVVLCLGPSAEAALAQAVQALGAGNAVVAIAPGARDVFAALTNEALPLRVFDGVAETSALSTLPIHCVALTGEELGAARKALAERDGPIVPFVTDLIAPASFAHERAVCVDTTAAGGNAALLARVGGEDMQAA
jgi:RHH-type proline utilization regulon transcriptional repressor/proline dehydrogenase/delta 1-pyrroline-5-carboxylate dehydrogenase